MPRILRELPFFEQPTDARLPDGSSVRVLGDQVVFWASLSLPEFRQLHEPRPFPVSLDTGFNGNFCIPERCLLEWAHLTPRDLAWVGRTRFEGRSFPLCDAAIWIHPNRPGSRDAFDRRPPYRLRLPRGIMVWPSGIRGGRRLPLLGVYAIRHAGLRFVVDGRRRRVSLGTPWSFWPFG